MKRIISLVIAVFMMMTAFPIVNLFEHSNSGLAITAEAATTKYTTTADLSLWKTTEAKSRYLIIYKGSSVTSTGKVSGKYQYVTYTKSGKTYNGWVLKAYLKKASTSVSTVKVKYTTTADLSLWKTAEAKSRYLIIYKGSSVTSTGKVSGKYQYVTYTKSGKTYNGWVLKAYLKKAGSASSSTPNSSYNKAADKAYKTMLKKFANGEGLPDKKGKYVYGLSDEVYYRICENYSDAPSSFKYCIKDYDNDGKNELVIRYMHSYTDTYFCEIFKYSESSKKVCYVDCADDGFIYSTGAVVSFVTHNHNCSYVFPYRISLEGKTYSVEAYHKKGYCASKVGLYPSGIEKEYNYDGAYFYSKYSKYDKDKDNVVYVITEYKGDDYTKEISKVKCDKAYFNSFIKSLTGGKSPVKFNYSTMKYNFELNYYCGY